jgi:hypothetical protein
MEGEEESFGYGNRTMAFKDVVLIHLKRIMELSACEMRGGYNVTITDKKGNERELYVEDSRERISNAIYAFSLLLQPKFDKIMKEKFKESIQKREELKQKFLESSSIEEKEVLGEGYYENTKDKVLLEEYKISKLQLYWDLFSELSNLLGRINYMEIGGGSFQ